MHLFSHRWTIVAAVSALAAHAISVVFTSPAASQSSVSPDDFVPQQIAILGALDKITARQRELAIPVGTSDRFYGLIVMVRTCQRTTMSTTPQDAAFLQITDESKHGKMDADDDRPSHHLFSGWMFSASPSLSGMEHPVYDIVLKGLPRAGAKNVQCSVAAPQARNPRDCYPPANNQTCPGQIETDADGPMSREKGAIATNPSSASLQRTGHSQDRPNPG